MGKDPGPPLPPVRRLSDDEVARGLDKLRELELQAMFTDQWSWGLQHDLMVWNNGVRRGEIQLAQLARMAEAFERFGMREVSARR